MTYEAKVKARFTPELARHIIENYCPHHVFFARRPLIEYCESSRCEECWKQKYREEELK